MRRRLCPGALTALLLALALLRVAPAAWAAPSPTHVLTAGDLTDLATYVTASHSVTANRLVLLAVGGVINAGSVPQPTITGHGATWALVNSGLQDRGGLFVFRTMVGANSTDTITIAFGSTLLRANWSIVEFSGVDTSGASGSGAVVQSAVNSTTTAALTVTLAAYASTDNRPYAAWYARQVSDVTPEAGWTQLGENAVESTTIMTMWKDATDDTTPSSSHADTAVFIIGVAAEIKTVTGATGGLMRKGVGP